jgi:hypothetical protein
MSTLTKKLSCVEGGVHKDYYKLALSGGATSYALVTGNNNVIHATYTIRGTEAKGLVHPNFSDAGVTVANGTVFFSSLTANETIDIEVTSN